MSVIVHNKLLEKIDPFKIPDHVAIIMDGNGRWARKLNKERFFGHNSGIKAVREAIDLSIELGIDTLTLYVFSMENWNRPKNEINALMVLLSKSIETELSKLIENNDIVPGIEVTTEIWDGIGEMKIKKLKYEIVKN